MNATNETKILLGSPYVPGDPSPVVEAEEVHKRLRELAKVVDPITLKKFGWDVDVEDPTP